MSLLTGGTRHTLETVRSLHDTVLALQTALKNSEAELFELRRKDVTFVREERESIIKNETRGIKIDRRFLNPMDGKEEENERKSEYGYDTESGDKYKVDSEAESDDIDDIELVFTTGETDPSSLHEDLVPIIEGPTRKSTTNTVVVETDISKCGVIDERDSIFSSRRNTLPESLPYQPLLHRELLAAARKAPIRSPCRAFPSTQETAAQTDITALPHHWKSETSLAHKMNYNLTTLPSKFTLPVPQPKRLPLSNKTCEARRVLLSDINFTSMVPELSRSADHLHDEKPFIPTRENSYDVVEPSKNGNHCDYVRQDSKSSWGSYYGSRQFSSNQFACEETCRRHSWRPHNIFCCRSKHFYRSSVPSSPIRCTHEMSLYENFGHLESRNKKTRLYFLHHCDPCRQSLPNLRLETDSGESTDSLLDETEECLRRSIDNIVLNTRRIRRISDADVTSDFRPPKTAQPFLPKTEKDLKRDCFVKVITPEGKVAIGRVRYSGHVPGRTEPYVGVELATDCGFSDGTFMGHHFFDCGPAHAIFVPFKKVVIAWENEE